jgi:hypothetical protein
MTPGLEHRAKEEGRRLGHLPERFEGDLGDKVSGEDATSFGGQVTKGIRWMPWHQEAKKDVAKLR